jgi:ABC-type oligopeptide transport system ATPase subunit
MELQTRHSLTYLYISHDLNFVSLFAHKIVVMQQGRIVESAPPPLLQQSLEPETRALLEAGRRLHVPGIEVAR